MLTGSNHGSIYSGSEIRQFMQNKVWNFAHYVVLRLYTEVNAKRKKQKKKTKKKNKLKIKAKLRKKKYGNHKLRFIFTHSFILMP